MVNLKSWAIVIFLLNLHISCQSFITIERKKKQVNKNKNPGQCPVTILTQMFPLIRKYTCKVTWSRCLLNSTSLSIFAIYLCSQKYNQKIERNKNLLKCFLLMVTFIFSVVVFMLQILLLMAKYCILDLHSSSSFHFLKTSFCSYMYYKLFINIYLLCINICFAQSRLAVAKT